MYEMAELAIWIIALWGLVRLIKNRAGKGGDGK